MNEKLTIVIPTYNRVKTLPRTLDSLERQTVKAFKCIIIDDGSTDGTEALVENMKATLSFPVEYYYQENQGVLSARLHGYERAETEMIMSLDSDDEITENAVEVLLRVWDSIPAQKRVCYCGVLCLVRNSETKEIHGGCFPEDINTCPHKRYLKRIWRGERFGIMRKEMILEEYKEFEMLKKMSDTKFVSEGVLNLKYELQNRFYCVNFPLRIYHTEGNDSLCRGGLTKETCWISYFGYTYTLRTYLPDRRIPFSRYFRSAMYTVKFALLMKKRLIKVYKDVGNLPNKLMLTLSLPFGVGNYCLGRKISGTERKED